MKLKPGYQLLLLVCITLSVYYPTLYAPFNSLDDQLLVNLLLNQEGFSLSRHFSPGGTYDYYRPLLTLTFEIDKHLGGLQEAFMHLVNVLLHAANVALVWLFARHFGRFVGRPSELLPFLAALLFALHPINTEAVNWIVARTDLLAGTFVLISLICLLRFIEVRSLLWGVLGALAILLGALCKETALFLIPGACFLLLCNPVVGATDFRWRWYLPGFYGIAVGGYFLLRWGAFQVDRGLSHTTKLVAHAAGVTPKVTDTAAVDPFPWLDAIRVVLKTSGFYTVKLFQPFPLNFTIHQVNDLYVIPGIILVGVLAVLAWRRRPVEWLFLASASIAISALFVVFTRLAWTPIAERYMYIPSAPFIVGLVYAGSSWKWLGKWQKPILIIMPLLLVGIGWATISRNIVWQDNLTLYQDTVRKSPDFALAKNQLALALLNHGRKEEALNILSENEMTTADAASLNRASAKSEKGDYPSAREDLLERLQDPGAQESEILDRLVKITCEQAVKIDNEKFKKIYYNDILCWLQRIVARQPNGFNFYRIGRVQLLLHNRAEAQRAFAEAAKRFPEDSLYREPATKLARNLAE